ncbi:MAG: DUF1150 family protein [Rhizobiaceae bacterium]|jgi:hypothetical protein|nr:DUF1150 family protein [Rhizobiaceae bacterium]
MFHYNDQNHEQLQEFEDLANMGSDAIAYMRQITAEEIAEAFPGTPELEPGHLYWALFAADGSPLVLADSQSDVSSSAFYNDLEAVLPN